MAIPTSTDFFNFIADAVATGIRKADAERAQANSQPGGPTPIPVQVPDTAAPISLPPVVPVPVPTPTTTPTPTPAPVPAPAPAPAASTEPVGVSNSAIGSPALVRADQAYFERSIWTDAYLKAYSPGDAAAAVVEFRKAFPL